MLPLRAQAQRLPRPWHCGGRAPTHCWLLEPLEDRLFLSASVLSELLFYKNSPQFDAGGNDDAAIATDKQPLLPGQTASFTNVSSYSRGINGLMVDLSGVSGTVSTADFLFKAGTTASPSGWAAAPVPSAVLARPGAGASGSTRVEIAWSDGAITNEWLQVTVLANTDTGLITNSVFYFGSAIGATGASPFGQVSLADEQSVHNDPHSLLNPATITDANDFNRDGRVDAADQILARNHTTSGQTGLLQLTAPPPPNLVTVATRQLTAYTELSITGTSSSDTISVTESGNTYNNPKQRWHASYHRNFRRPRHPRGLWEAATSPSTLPSRSTLLCTAVRASTPSRTKRPVPTTRLSRSAVVPIPSPATAYRLISGRILPTR